MVLHKDDWIFLNFLVRERERERLRERERERERERDSGRPARGSGGQSECREGQPVSVGGQPKGLEASEGQGGQPQGLHASQSI